MEGVAQAVKKGVFLLPLSFSLVVLLPLSLPPFFLFYLLSFFLLFLPLIIPVTAKRKKRRKQEEMEKGGKEEKGGPEASNYTPFFRRYRPNDTSLFLDQKLT